MTKTNPYETPLEYITVGEDDITRPIGIMMHGFGAHAGDLIDVARSFTEDIPYWILPQAPVQLIAFLGHESYAWFPSNQKDLMDAFLGKFFINTEELDSKEMELAGKKIIGEIIYPIREESLSRPIVVAGFSQGGMMVSEIVLQAMAQDIVINTAIMMSSCLLAEKRWNEHATKYIREDGSDVKVPNMWQSHGRHDHVLTFAQGKKLDAFWNKYTQKDLFEFDGGHEIPSEVIFEIKKFIREQRYIK